MAFSMVITQFVFTANCVYAVGDPEIGKGKPVTSSKEDTAGGNLATNANDGDVATRWYDGDNTKNGNWIMVDLGEKSTLSKIKVEQTQQDVRASEYTIQVSDNGTDFSNIKKITASTQIDEFAVAGVGRYVRLYIDTRGQWGTSIYEFEIYGNKYVAPLIEKKDLVALYDANASKEKGNYTDESWSFFQTALIEAKKVIEDVNATEKAIGTAI